MKNIYKNIKIESLSDSTKIIWISRPDKLNALDDDTLKEIMNVFDKFCSKIKGTDRDTFNKKLILKI